MISICCDNALHIDRIQDNLQLFELLLKTCSGSSLVRSAEDAFNQTPVSSYMTPLAHQLGYHSTPWSGLQVNSKNKSLDLELALSDTLISGAHKRRFDREM